VGSIEGGVKKKIGARAATPSRAARLNTAPASLTLLLCCIAHIALSSRAASGGHRLRGALARVSRAQHA
jgi:hypothetical protein